MQRTGDSVANFWIGRNPGSKRFPFVLRVPVPGEGRLFLAAVERWPRVKDVFCYQLEAWPETAEVLEEVPVEACVRVGAALHLTLQRARSRRSLFVWTKNRSGRTAIFWRSQSSMRASRPGIRIPHARGLTGPLGIVVDVAERYPWRFVSYDARITRRALPVGDYAVLSDDVITAVVERKTPADLVGAAIAGRLQFVLADLAQTPRAALVVEGRLSDVVKTAERGRARPGWLLNILATHQVSHPRVMWMFAETPRLAEDWAYRWLAASIRATSASGVELERAYGARPIQVELPLGPAVMDAAARRALIARESDQGTIWTSRTAAVRCGVSQTTAASDLKALVGYGILHVEGSGRSRTYRANVSAMTTPTASR